MVIRPQRVLVLLQTCLLVEFICGVVLLNLTGKKHSWEVNLMSSPVPSPSRARQLFLLKRQQCCSSPTAPVFQGLWLPWAPELCNCSPCCVSVGAVEQPQMCMSLLTDSSNLAYLTGNPSTLLLFLLPELTLLSLARILGSSLCIVFWVAPSCVCVWNNRSSTPSWTASTKPWRISSPKRQRSRLTRGGKPACCKRKQRHCWLKPTASCSCSKVRLFWGGKVLL